MALKREAGWTARLVLLTVTLAACGAGGVSPGSTSEPPAVLPTPTSINVTAAPATVAVTATPAPVAATATPADTVAVCSYEVVTSYPHDREAYTQGLAFDDGRLFEGTGLLGKSSVREVDLDSGQVVKLREIGDEHFGEGIAIIGDRLFQLTLSSQKGFIYDVRTLAPIGQFAYESAGWGLTYDGRHLIMSDGTARLRFLDPESFAVLRTLQVRAGGKPVDRLNELEYVDGEIFANVYQTDLIARIEPETGEVTAWIDLAGLLAPKDRTPSAEVLNGIAYNGKSGRLVVTGKRWPRLYEIRLVPGGAGSVCSPVGAAHSQAPPN